MKYYTENEAVILNYKETLSCSLESGNEETEILVFFDFIDAFMKSGQIRTCYCRAISCYLISVWPFMCVCVCGATFWYDLFMAPIKQDLSEAFIQFRKRNLDDSTDKLFSKAGIAARSKARTVFARSNTGIVGSNPT
jgi:hypothetical protein